MKSNVVKKHLVCKYSQPRAKQQGFTLIEIMVVVVIVGLLATLILPNVLGQQEKAFQVKAKADVRAIGSQLQLYKIDNYSYPNTSQGLQALVTNPGGKKNWTGYLDRLPKDPWDGQYQYIQPGQKNPSTFDLWSFGADGVAGGEGANQDIGNWDSE